MGSFACTRVSSKIHEVFNNSGKAAICISFAFYQHVIATCNGANRILTTAFQITTMPSYESHGISNYRQFDFSTETTTVQCTHLNRYISFSCSWYFEHVFLAAFKPPYQLGTHKSHHMYHQSTLFHLSLKGKRFSHQTARIFDSTRYWFRVVRSDICQTLVSSAAEASVKFQSDTIILTPKPASSRISDIW